MSLLWRNKRKQKLLTIHDRPSPKYKNYILSLARGVQKFVQLEISPYQLKLGNSIKGISLLTFLFRKLRAGMTVEASLVLPLFLFLFLNLTGAIEMLRLHGKLQLALWDVGRRLSVYNYVLQGEEASWMWQEFKDVAISYAYVRGELIEYVGEEYLEESPLTYGAEGLQFWESEIYTEDDGMEIVVTYNVSPVTSLAGFRPFRMANRYYGHVWNGYNVAEAEAVDTEVVFVTENGEVYHRNRSCTHLLLSVRERAMEEVFCSRNEQGGRYVACEKCVRDAVPDRVLITDDGDCYHYDRECPGLKRTVLEINKEEATGYRPCRRCSSGG